MRKLVPFAILASLVVAAPAAVFGQSAPGMTIGSKAVVLNVDGSLPELQNGSSFFEARISANDSALMISAIIVETNKTGEDGEPMVNVTGASAYFPPNSEPIAYSGHIDSQWFSSDGQSSFLVNSEPLPISIPEGGIFGITLGTSGLENGDQVKVTFVYLVKPESTIAVSTIPVAKIGLSPLDIATVSRIAGSSGISVDDAFSDPETHCELCTMIDYNPEGPGEAAYVSEMMHLEGVREVQFWARGEQGNETGTFKAAGKRGPDGAVAYANAMQITLSQEWGRYEIDIPTHLSDTADLSSITHLFAFETASNSNQTIYLKGIAYH